MRHLLLPIAASALALALTACGGRDDAAMPTDTGTPATGTAPMDPMMPPPADPMGPTDPMNPTDPMAPPMDPMNPVDPNAPIDPMMPPADETQMPPMSPETPPAMDSTSSGT